MRMTGILILLVLTSLMPRSAVRAQESVPAHQHEHMPGMEHGNTQQKKTPPSELIEQILAHETSGTSVEAEISPTTHNMLMWHKAGWMWMFHGEAFLNFEQQSGARGYDKVFSTNWFMPMAQRSLGPGQLTLRSMVSLEPATVTHRFYPELFQQGETAFGRPINDGQHPHDFLMEIAALYDWKLGEKALLSFYAAPVGDPAMGPVAYAHRASAAENPMAPLGHHLQDSTHIADDVFTGGFAYKLARIEASGFHGREPDEQRWDLDSGKVDSWSTRFTVQFPQKIADHVVAQYSFAHLTSPEQLHPLEDVQRMTASLSYDFWNGEEQNTAATLLWGRNHSLLTGENFNGYLAEGTLGILQNNLWARIENVDRTSDLLLGKNPEPPGFDETFLARVQGYTFGYDHQFDWIPGLSTAIGGQVMLYGTPARLKPIYGDHPLGGVLFVRFRQKGNKPTRASLIKAGHKH
jgi:hypothetical protein